MTKTAKRTLYICYFGLRQPLVQTQVIPYLREISKDGIETSLLTFEPNFRYEWNAEQIESEKENLAAKGIEWHCLPYHKRFSVLATAFDIFAGACFVWRMIAAKDLDVLHGRVHVPALMGALARKFSKRKPRLLFDIRGFFPEEYTDAGVWPPNGVVYRIVKRVEAWLMKQSDGFVVLTEKAREILFPNSKESGFDTFGRPIEVIPCCVDLEQRFSGRLDDLRDETRLKLGVKERFVFTHVGALGGLYLTEEIVDFLQAARSSDPTIFALFLIQNDSKQIVRLLLERGFSQDDYFVGSVDPRDVPAYLRASDVGLSFVKSGYATQSRSPTKIPEYLACGLPIIANSGVGDVDSLIDRTGVGVLIHSFTSENYLKAVESIVKIGDVRERCREVAKREFDLSTVGGQRYRRLYQRLLDVPGENSTR